MHEQYEEDDATTTKVARSAQDDPKDAAPTLGETAPPAALQKVQERFPEVSGKKRRVNFLFNKDGASFFRVNFHDRASGAIESHWVKVRDGVVVAEAEANRPFKADDK